MIDIVERIERETKLGAVCDPTYYLNLLDASAAEITALRADKAELLAVIKPFAEIETQAPSLTGVGPSYIFHDDGSLHKASEAARAAIAKLEKRK